MGRRSYRRRDTASDVVIRSRTSCRAKRGKRVVLHCRSGNRSAKALAIAQSYGRDDVRAHFGGGMLEWAAAGEPIER